MVFINNTTGYYFFTNGDSDLDYSKTTDGGATWGVAVDVLTETVSAFGIWYDQWTPGNTDRDIHIWLVEDGTDDVSYFRFNTTNDTKTAIVDVLAGNTTVPGRGEFVTGTRTRGGNLLCAFDIDAGAEKGMYKSTDNGVTWSAMTDPIEATLDQCQLFPANAADANDAWLLYDDDSATELTIKTYDDSGNSFG